MSTFIKTIIVRVDDGINYTEQSREVFIEHMERVARIAQYSRSMARAISRTGSDYRPTLLSVKCNTVIDKFEESIVEDGYMVKCYTLVTYLLEFESKKSYKLFKLCCPNFSRAFTSSDASVVGDGF